MRSLADYETSVWLDATLAAEPAVAAWIRFQTGAPIVTDPQQAAFALIGNANELPDFATFSNGSADYPDRSMTLIVQIARFSGSAFCLAGPGVQAERPLAAEPLPDDFVERCAGNRAMFPRGIDSTGSAAASPGCPAPMRGTEGLSHVCRRQGRRTRHRERAPAARA